MAVRIDILQICRGGTDCVFHSQCWLCSLVHTPCHEKVLSPSTTYTAAVLCSIIARHVLVLLPYFTAVVAYRTRLLSVHDPTDLPGAPPQFPSAFAPHQLHPPRRHSRYC